MRRATSPAETSSPSSNAQTSMPEPGRVLARRARTSLTPQSIPSRWGEELHGDGGVQGFVAQDGEGALEIDVRGVSDQGGVSDFDVLGVGACVYHFGMSGRLWLLVWLLCGDGCSPSP